MTPFENKARRRLSITNVAPGKPTGPHESGSGICPSHNCRTAVMFAERVRRTVVAFRRSCARHAAGQPLSRHALFRLTSWGTAVIKIAIVAGATFAVVTAAGAADIPRRQPVYQQAPVGKMPIGKTPVGKSPIGKAPGPVVSRY
jgi:hypothetical protein